MSSLSLTLYCHAFIRSSIVVAVFFWPAKKLAELEDVGWQGLGRDADDETL
jgi:hypothetical protein